MIIKPRVRGFICVTTHPVGCEANVKEQIDYVTSHGPIANGPKKVLVIGASTGYGLAARISAAFGSDADTLGVFFERAGSETPGTAGWYNTAAFEKFAAERRAQHQRRRILRQGQAGHDRHHQAGSRQGRSRRLQPRGTAPHAPEDGRNHQLDARRSARRSRSAASTPTRK